MATPRHLAGEDIEIPQGTVLGNRYEILERLGVGGMGAVYAAHDQLLGREVALKFIVATMASMPEERSRLRDEVCLAQFVTHLNVARTYTLEMLDSLLFIVMERLHGPTLGERLREGPIAIAAAVDITRQLLAGLSAAHSQGVIHRDIKPSNIKLCEGGRVVLMDFGIARVSESTSSPVVDTRDSGASGQTTLAGTPGFIAPEVVAGIHGDARADLYALGAVLYEMLAGVPPFSADTPAELLARHVTEPVADIRKTCPKAPAKLAQLVARLLAKNPGDRFASAEEAAAFLKQIATSSSRRWKRAIAIAGGVVIAGAVVFAIARPSRAPAPGLAEDPKPPLAGSAEYDGAPSLSNALGLDAGNPEASPSSRLAPGITKTRSNAPAQRQLHQPNKKGKESKVEETREPPAPTPVPKASEKRKRMLDLEE